jgi:hypothetical protein
MSRLNDATTETNLKNPAIILYGTRGIGKTSTAAQLEKPLFFALEKGLGRNKTPHITRDNYDDVILDLKALINEKHEYKTLVIDTIDRLEQLLFEKIAKAHSKGTIAEIGYGKGYEEAASILASFLRGLDILRDTKGMTIVLISHSKIKAINDPTDTTYDKYLLALNDKTAKVFCDWAEAILFADFSKDIVDGKAVGGAKKYLITGGKVSVEAKNRAGLPDKIDFSNINALRDVVNKIKSSVDNEKALLIVEGK